MSFTIVETYSATSDDLEGILNRYPANTDYLSRNIYRWMANFLDEVAGKSLSEQLRIAVGHIEALFSDVVVNAPPTHHFAREMIDWGSKCLSKMRVHRQITLRRKMDETLDEFLTEFFAIDRSNQEVLLRVNLRLEAGEEQFAEVKRMAGERAQDLVKQLEVTDALHAVENAGLEARVVEEQKAEVVMTTILQSNLNRVEVASSSALQAMGQHVETAVRTQNQLETQLNAQTVQHAQLQEKVPVLQQSLHGLQGRAGQLAQEQQNATSARERDQQELRYLRGKIADLKDNCVVM